MNRLAKTAAAVCLCLLLLTGCTQYASFPNKSTFSQVQEDGPVQMQVQTLDLENKTVKLVIQNSSAQQASFDKTTVLEREQNGVWYAMQDERSVESIGILLNANEKTDYAYSWEQPLPKGAYRLVKSFYLPQGKIDAAAYFTVE